MLVVDPVAVGKPAGADPLDIRDHADWCDPLLELDPAASRLNSTGGLGRRFAAWKDWTAAPAGGGTLLEAGAGADRWCATSAGRRLASFRPPCR